MSELYHNKLLEIINILPAYCMDYFSSLLELSIKTRLAYAGDLKVFFEYLSNNTTIDVNDILAIKEVKHKDIETFLNYMKEYEYNGQIYKNSDAGIRRKITSLNSFFRYLRGSGKIEQNPMDLVKIEKQTSAENITNNNLVLRTEEQENLINEVIEGQNKTAKALVYHDRIKFRDKSIIMLFLFAGISLSELVSLDISDFDFEKKTLYIRKMRKQKTISKTISLDADTFNTLVSYIEKERNDLITYCEEELYYREYPEGPLFVSLKHNRLSLRQVENIVKSYARNVLPKGVKINPNLLRKTFIHNYYTGNEKLLQALGLKKEFTYIDENEV